MIRLLRTHFRAILLIVAIYLLMMTSVLSLNGQEINIPTVTQNVCPDLQFLMDRTVSPYDLGVGGGTLNIGGTTTGSISNAWYADLWSFNFASQSNQTDILTLRFNSNSDAVQLEFALFLGMDKVSADNGQSEYQSTGDSETSYSLRRDGIYTLVVRQAALSASTDEDLNGTYSINASLSSGRQYATPPEPRTDVRDETTNRSVSPAPIIPAGNGYQFIDLQTDLYTHPNAVFNVSSLNFSSTRAEYGIVGSGFLLNTIYDEVQLLGGDLVIKGTAPETNQSRILYVQNYDYRTFFGDNAGNLTAIQSEDGTNIQLNWDIMQGVWITENCAGFMLNDGTRFISPIIPQQRTVTFRTDRTQPDEFDIRLVAPNPASVATRYEIDLNWRGVQPASQLSLVEGMFNLELIDGRSLHLEATRMDIRRVDDNPIVVPTTPLSVSLLGRGSTLLIDWVDLNSFTLTNTLGMFNFDDTRGTVSRELIDLDRLEIIGGNVYTIFDNAAQNLWLGQENGFVELITPATTFPYSSLAVAGETGYIPHALNNTGGECYPVNTMLPEANCPPNGYPNPANGNLWLSITDLQAFGGLIDVTLNRNYNSLFSAVDGPFGAGWTGLFLLDYNVEFDT